MSIPIYREIYRLSLADHGEISGLEYDNCVSLGITYSSLVSFHSEIPDPSPAILGDQGMRGIATIVQLKDVQRIDVWYTDDRCMGMMINFIDTRQDSLGRWDEGSEQFHRDLSSTESTNV